MGKNDKYNSPKDNTSFRDEFYGRSKEVNESIKKANSIYRRDANNVVNAKNFAGKEVNDLSSKLNKRKKISYSSQETSTEAASSAGSTAGSTVTSVIAATTTAVVVVVGGGALIYSQTFTRPAICEMKAYTEENAIHYSLLVGDDKEKLFSGEEKGECNLIVELVCEKYETPMTEEITEYGIHDGAFKDLEYDTEYTLGVYMMEFMDINKAYLIEPTTYYISSESPEPQTNYISIDATHDSDDNWAFYVSVDYYEDVSMYHDFYLELYEGSYDDQGQPIPINPNAGEGNFVCYASLNDDFQVRQEVIFDIMDYEGLYWVAFGGMIDPAQIQSTRPPLRADTDIPSEQHAIFWELIDFSTIPVEYIELPPQNTIHFDAISDPFGNCEYYSYTEFYDDKPEYYFDYEVDFYSVLWDENTDEPIDFDVNYGSWETWFQYNNEYSYDTRQLINDFQMPKQDRYYWAVLECNSRDPIDIADLDSDSGDDYKHIYLFWQLIDVTQIPTTMVETHNEFYGKAKYAGSFTNYYGYFMIEDAYYYSNLYWQLCDLNDDGEISYTYASGEIANLNEIFLFDFNGTTIDSAYDYTLVLGGDSMNPKHIEEYEEVNTDHEEGQPVPVSDIYHQTVFFGSMDTDYLSSPFLNCDFIFRQSYTDGNTKEARAEFELNTPDPGHEYDFDLDQVWIRFIDGGNEFWYTDALFIKQDNNYYLATEGLDSLWEFLFDGSHETINMVCSCIDRTIGNGNEFFIKCYEQEIEGSSISYEYIAGSVWFTSEVSHTLSGRIMYEAENPYTNMYVKFIDAEDSSKVYYLYDLEPNVVFDVEEADILNGGEWYVETYGYLEDSSSPTLIYREHFNFSAIIMESI